MMMLGMKRHIKPSRFPLLKSKPRDRYSAGKVFHVKGGTERPLCKMAHDEHVLGRSEEAEMRNKS